MADPRRIRASDIDVAAITTPEACKAAMEQCEEVELRIGLQLKEAHELHGPHDGSPCVACERGLARRMGGDDA